MSGDNFTLEQALLRYCYKNPPGLASLPVLDTKVHNDMVDALKKLMSPCPSLEDLRGVDSQLVDGSTEYWEALLINNTMGVLGEEVFLEQCIGFTPEETEGIVSTDDLDDAILSVIENSPRAIRQIEILPKVNKIIHPPVDKRRVSSRIKSMLDREVLFRLDPTNRRSPLTLERAINTDGISLIREEVKKNIYPIFPAGNELLGGGLIPGEVYFYNGDTDAGKSYWFLTTLVNALNYGLKAKYVFLEGSNARIIDTLEHITNKKFEDTPCGDKDKVSFVDMRSGSFTRHTLFKICKDQDVVIIDYLKLDTFSGTEKSLKLNGKPGSTNSQMIAEIAALTNCTIVTGVQIEKIEKGIGGKYLPQYDGGKAWIKPIPFVWTVVNSERSADERHINLTVMVDKDKQIRSKIYRGKMLKIQIDINSTKYTYLPDAQW